MTMRTYKKKKKKCSCRFGYYPECPYFTNPHLCKKYSPSARNPTNYTNVKKYGKQWRRFP